MPILSRNWIIEPKIVTMKTVAPFQDGERIVCLGDSITQDGAWLYFLAQYVLVHTGQRVDFIDAGISGGCTDGALQRLDFDVIDRRPSRVLVMLGMNDVRRQLYCTETPDDRLAAERREALDLFRERIRQVIERLVAKKIEVVLLTTFPFDQYRPGLIPVRDSVCCNNEGLSRLNDILRNLAEEYGLSLIDIFTPLTELYRQHPEFRFAEDRVHPKRFGHLLAAALIVETVYGRTSMGELFLSPDQVRCGMVEASGVEFSSTGMRFVCRPGCLPFPRDEDYRLASRLRNLDPLFNHEIWKIAGLPEQRYQLRAGGIDCGRFYASELEAGIDSTLLPTPAMAQAENVSALVEALRYAGQRQRQIIQLELIVRENGGDPENEISARKELDDFLVRIAEQSYHGYFRDMIGEYWKELRASRTVYNLRRAEVLQTLWTAFLPAPYAVELIPCKWR